MIIREREGEGGIKKETERGLLTFFPWGKLIEGEGLFESGGSIGDLWYLSPYNCDQLVN